MKAILRFLAPLLVLAAMGCGQYSETDENPVEKFLAKVFVMDTGKENSPKTLSKNTVELLLLDNDDSEEKVISSLKRLKDSDFSIEKEQKEISISLKYIDQILKRSELLPKEKRSKCQCSYKTETFKLATETLGHFLIAINKEHVTILASEKPKQYQDIYRQFKDGKTLLEDLSKVDSIEMASIKDERETIDSIKALAKKYLSELESKKEESPKESKEDNKKD